MEGRAHLLRAGEAAVEGNRVQRPIGSFEQDARAMQADAFDEIVRDQVQSAAERARDGVGAGAGDLGWAAYRQWFADMAGRVGLLPADRVRRVVSREQQWAELRLSALAVRDRQDVAAILGSEHIREEND